MNILRDNNYDSVITELKDISSHNKVLKNQILSKLKEFNIDNIDSLDSFYNYIDKQIGILESEIDSLRYQVSSLLAQRETEYNNLQNKRSKLESLQSEYNYIDIKKSLESAKRIISEYDKIFKQMGLMNIDHITKNEFDTAMESLVSLKDMGIALSSSYTQDQLSYIVNNFNAVQAMISNIPNIMQELNPNRIKLPSLQSGQRLY